VRRVREAGIAVVIVDKNFKAVNAVTDRNVILVKGRVVYAGPSRELAVRDDIRLAHLGI
jgi:branched-chain amino acid transport system ATP-binding protein